MIFQTITSIFNTAHIIPQCSMYKALLQSLDHILQQGFIQNLTRSNSSTNFSCLLPHCPLGFSPDPKSIKKHCVMPDQHLYIPTRNKMFVADKRNRKKNLLLVAVLLLAVVDG
ncbi:hypothetical protein CEXT_640071 [Caerostris extrusa]|uniref:Uncharacterized protein n=1 Tax=Caerostris extrusa TaxID=172846 RepID=A0AAV4W280_CAEEX|nr:hypothetical protein CEXT_640071 [Caerostris extrusa]